MSLYRYLLPVGLALSVAAVSAAPAPWYKWHSPEVDYDICAQFSPGPGWEVVKGPFQDAQCRKPGTP